LLLAALLHAIAGSPATHNYELRRNECVGRRRSEFAVMEKLSKIRINGRQMGYFGFNESASAVIILDISQTDIRVHQLNLSFTNMLMLHASYGGLESFDDISPETFPSLKFLNLSRNAISSVKSQLYSHLYELEILDLSHNCFLHFSFAHEMRVHENLKKLYLHDNLIHKIDSATALQTNSRLKFLDISHNNIADFDSFGLQIGYLDVSSNALKRLAITDTHLMHLDAHNNKLAKFESTATFVYLNLSFNGFRSVINVKVSSSSILDLSHNLIETRERSSESSEDFEDTRMPVEMLYLTHNKITSMSALDSFKNCLEVDLESNRLSDINYNDLKMSLPTLLRLNIKDNPLTNLDISEMIFHNETKFLGVQFHYDVTTKAPALLPPLPVLGLLPPPHKLVMAIIQPSTTPTVAVTETQQIESSTAQPKSTITIVNERQFDARGDEMINIHADDSVTMTVVIGLVGLLIVSAIIGSIYLRYRSGVINQNNYNEVENFDL